MAQAGSAVALGARYHQDHPTFEDYPFAEGDLSYGAAYEYREENGVVQLAALWTPEFSENELIDYAITPQLNMLLRDRYIMGGMGILSTYVSSELEEEWMDMYWQFILGLSIPLGKRMNLDASAYYPFKEWDQLGDFEAEDIEFGGWIGYRF
jgi:hypothetical protein